MEKIINKDLKIAPLNLNDIESIDKLLHECEDYYLLHNGTSHTKKDIEEILTFLPPNKQSQDKFVLGIFYKNQLIGVIDLIRDFPVIGQWIIGLFLLNKKVRRKGIGKLVHNALSQIVLESTGDSLRIGVIEENINGLNFWKNLGYKQIKECEMEMGNKLHKVSVMVLELKYKGR